MNYYEEFSFKHKWFIPAIESTFNYYKDINVIFFRDMKSNSWLKSKNRYFKRKTTTIDLALAGFETLFLESLGINLGKIKQLEIEGKRNSIFSKQVTEMLSYAVVGRTRISQNEVNESLLEHALENHVQLQENNDFIGLVTPEGFPIWVQSKEPNYLIEESLTACFFALERLQLDLNLGPLNSCTFYGQQSRSLDIKMNLSNDLAIIVYTSQLLEIDQFIKDFFLEIQHKPQKIRIPENLLLQFQSKGNISNILQDMRTLTDSNTEDISDDEMVALIGFDEALLDRMTTTLKTLQKTYNVREVSISYLRKLFRLPSAVIQLSLSYLISKGDLGHSRLQQSDDSLINPDLLLLDIFVPTDTEQSFLDLVNSEITNLMSPLRKTLKQLDNYSIINTSTTHVLNELVAIRQSSDPYSLINLAKGMKDNVSSILKLKYREEQRKLQKESVLETDNFMQKVEVDVASLKKDHEIFINEIRSLSTILSRLIPIPSEILDNSFDNKNFYSLRFSCENPGCPNSIMLPISKSILAWQKYLFFLPEQNKNTSINKFTIQLEKKFDTIPKQLDLSSNEEFSWNLEEFILQIEERELLLKETQKSIEFEIQEEEGFHSLANYRQCIECEGWFCPNHYNFEQFMCKQHERSLGV